MSAFYDVLSSTSADCSPTGLRFASALRGVQPAKPETPFSYGIFLPSAEQSEASRSAMDEFLALAASNPEGRFFGFVANDAVAESARQLALTRHVFNVLFVAGTPQTLAENPAAVPKLDFLVIETTDHDASREALWNGLSRFARAKLRANGLLAWTYPTSNAHALAWLRTRVLGSQDENGQETKDPVHVSQTAQGILALAARVFETLPDERAAWESLMNAPAQGVSSAPSAFPSGDSQPMALAVADLLTHEDAFDFVGDGVVRANYLELSAPESTHEFLLAARDNTLYEVFKDLAMGRTTRTDLWCRTPVTRTAALAELFGGFTFGLGLPRTQIPPTLKTETTTLSLTDGIYAALVELLDTLPVTIGDCLAHPSLKDQPFQAVFDSLMVLAAVGVARPMRTSYQGHKKADFLHPVWGSSYNKKLNAQSFATPRVMLASTTTGSPVSVPLREALVLQAVTRVGVQESPKVLLSELSLLNSNPALVAAVSETVAHTEESVAMLVSETVARNMPRWYAWGLLAA